MQFAEPSRGPERISVLVVEDNGLILLDAVETLEDSGYTVLSATTADEALKMLSSQGEVDLLFTDVDLPGKLDGLTLAEIVHQRWPNIKLVVTSGHAILADDDLPDQGIFVKKPYQTSRLAETFRELVEEGHS